LPPLLSLDLSPSIPASSHSFSFCILLLRSSGYLKFLSNWFNAVPSSDDLPAAMSKFDSPLDPKFIKDLEDPDFQEKLNLSNEKSENLLIDLLAEMAKSLNYNFDKVHLHRAVYLPKGNVMDMEEQQFIRQTVARFLSGEVSILIKVVK
jgi:hypothetical protein